MKKLLQHVSVLTGTIIRKPKSVPSQNYRYGSTVLVDMNAVSVMAAYSDLLCVCVVHRAERYCATAQYLPAR
jgi:hypothetical protein